MKLQKLFSDVRSRVRDDVLALNVMHVLLGLRKMAWLPRLHPKLDGLLVDDGVSVLHVHQSNLRFTSVARLPLPAHQRLLHAYSATRGPGNSDPRIEQRVGSLLGYIHPRDLNKTISVAKAGLGLCYDLRDTGNFEPDPIFIQTVDLGDPELLRRVRALRRRYQSRLRKIFPKMVVHANIEIDE